MSLSSERNTFCGLREYVRFECMSSTLWNPPGATSMLAFSVGFFLRNLRPPKSQS